VVESVELFLMAGPSRCQMGADRLFDDDAPPCPVLLAGQAGSSQLAADRRESRGRRGDIEQTVAARRARLLDALEFMAEPFVCFRILEVALPIWHAGEQPFGNARVHLTRRKLAQ